ncbi:hypothetical protein [Nocardia sp. NPDC004604]|uniref:hypothetical protein n=1 Tax=Nocardia sp. NPDC004604 TaxID=3157013 RepID=UPI0033B45F6E
MTHPRVAALTQILSPPPIDVEGKYQVQFPPPLSDSGGDRFDWDDLAARTGWRYPSDYRSFVETFGAGGEISETIGIESPPPAGVEYRVDRQAVYPPADGLHRWGSDDAADDFYWRCTDPDPDRWTVAVRTRDSHDGKQWFDYPMGMVDFLIGLLDGTLDVPLGVDLHYKGPDTPQSYQSWRMLDLEVRAEYPDFKGSWALSELPDRWYEA